MSTEKHPLLITTQREERIFGSGWLIGVLTVIFYIELFGV